MNKVGLVSLSVEMDELPRGGRVAQDLVRGSLGLLGSPCLRSSAECR